MSGIRLSNEDLKHLLPRCLKRDEEAWVLLFNGLYGFVKAEVLRVHSRDEDVQDGVADAFHNVIDGLADVAQAQNPLGYIAAVARHAAYASRRRVLAVAIHEVEWASNENEKFSEPAGPPEAAHQPVQGLGLMTQRIEDEVARCLGRLDPVDRRLLRLKYANDLSYEEMAYILGKESGALRVAMHRLAKTVRASLSPEIRDEVFGDPRLLNLVSNPDLSTPAGADSHEAAEEFRQYKRLLEDYVAAPQELSPSDREEIEAALLASSSLRERKVFLERQLSDQEYDVFGHSAETPAPMPTAMLNGLMNHVLGGGGHAL